MRRRREQRQEPTNIILVPEIRKLTGERLELVIKLLKGVKILHDKGCWIIKDDWSEYFVLDKIRGHRISYDLFSGDLIEGLYICHRCDRKGCINPKHLFQDTASENTRDWRRKRYRVNIDRHANRLLWEVGVKQAVEYLNKSESFISSIELDKRRRDANRKRRSR